MTPRTIRAEVVLDKAAWVGAMLVELRRLPLASLEEFVSDHRNPAAAESFQRRALEGVLDLGRHILSKGFGEGVVEYKKVAERLAAHGVVGPETGRRLAEMAGFRNRLVHFYDEPTHQELFEICAGQSAEVEGVVAEIVDWLRRHPERLDASL